MTNEMRCSCEDEDDDSYVDDGDGGCGQC